MPLRTSEDSKQACNRSIPDVDCQKSPCICPWCVLCDTGSIMFSIHSGIDFRFSTGFLGRSPKVLLIVWGHNTAILSAKSSWSNKICLCWSEKTWQDIWTQPWRICNKWKRSCVSCNTHFLCCYFWLSLPHFFPKIRSTKTFQLT